jgi:cellulose synthase/poly-beta-1,6-N-acetylglucosamine synthase-like glycosyltransferase
VPAEGSLDTASVSLIVSAYNEEDVILEKLKNTSQLAIPQGHFEVLIGSDGSNDATSEQIRSFIKEQPPHHPFQFFDFAERSGKAAVLNRLVQKAQGEILIFCDANTMLLKNALHQLLIPFAHPKVGGVCGKLTLKNSSNSPLSTGERFYWKMESEIKKLEGSMGSLIGANGGLYAIRKPLFCSVPEDKRIVDDFFITTEVLKQGYRVLYEPLAIGREEMSLDKMGEFKRKARIGEANFNYLMHFLKLLNPTRPLVAYCFCSHKLIRWFTPILLIGVYALSILYWRTDFVWSLLCYLQTGFYLSAGVGWYLQKKEQKRPLLFSIPYYFMAMNAALLTGFFRSFLKKKEGFWDTERR